MDAKMMDLAWILGAGGGCALLGALFGGISGAIQWRNGNAIGTVLGLEVAGAFERISMRALSPAVKGAVIGAVDGLVFLGVLGTVGSAVVVASGEGGKAVLLPAMLALLLLMAGALLFGLLALGMARAGIRGVAGLFAGAMCGSVSGLYLGGSSGLILGCVAGLFAGNLFALGVRPRAATPPRPETPDGDQDPQDP